VGLRTTFRLSLLALQSAVLLCAAQAPRLSFEDLVNGAQFIVRGRVARSWTAWDSRHAYIWTHHEIEVSNAIRGSGSRIAVSEPGGELDGIGQSFGGALPYAPGETVLLFLERTPIGFLRAVGGGQGKFSVGPDGRARPNLAGMELVDMPGRRRGTPLSSLDGLNLNELERRVRGAASLYPYRPGASKP
jgi:hypothetical protein